LAVHADTQTPSKALAKQLKLLQNTPDNTQHTAAVGAKPSILRERNRTGSPKLQATPHNISITSVHVYNDRQILSTASTSTSGCRLWDLRKIVATNPQPVQTFALPPTHATSAIGEFVLDTQIWRLNSFNSLVTQRVQASLVPRSTARAHACVR
jgi:hypothetical protein